MTPNFRRKREAVAKILRQDYYLPEAGLYRRVQQRLLQMSLPFLEDLALLIEQKMFDALVEFQTATNGQSHQQERRLNA